MPGPPSREQIERLALLSPAEQERLLALRKQEEAEFNDDELEAKEKTKKLQNAIDKQKRKGSISGNALNGLTPEQKSETLLGLGGKRTKRTKRSTQKRRRKTQKKSHSRRSRHAR